MSGAIVDLLIQSSLRALLLAALVATCLGALRVRASGLRHGAWTAVLAGMLLMPVLTRIIPVFPVAVPNVPPGLVIHQAMQHLRDEWVPGGGAATPTPAASQLRELARQTGPAASSPRQSWSWDATGLCVYVIGLLVLLTRTWSGWRQAARLIAASQPIVPPDLAGIAWDADDDVRESPAASVPLVVGWIRPVIVLPVDWRRWTDMDLRAVLAHELAHVARRDPFVAALAHANACLFWFHPLAWWLKRHLAILAERACDEAGVRGVGDRQAYAQALIRMAARARRSGGCLQPHAVGIDGQGPLARRSTACCGTTCLARRDSAPLWWRRPVRLRWRLLRAAPVATTRRPGESGSSSSSTTSPIQKSPCRRPTGRWPKRCCSNAGRRIRPATGPNGSGDSTQRASLDIGSM
jgi:hypothetical protein